MKEQRTLATAASFVNPDLYETDEEYFTLRKESLPSRLHPLLENYAFRRCTMAEILESRALTRNAWPGMLETQELDLMAREMINAPVCGVFDRNGEMVAYTRLMWGLDNKGKPEIFSHMTAVRETIRDGGIGEALKWLARQAALEFPQQGVGQLTATFDNLQGRNCHVNLNKLGMVCGYAGGRFRKDTYPTLSGKQHIGNPTDRYQGRWYLNSDWTLAHLQERVREFKPSDVELFTQIVQYEFVPLGGIKLAYPKEVDTKTDNDYVVLPIPFDWDQLLTVDKDNGYAIANEWRQATREAITTYHSKGYTTIAQVSDREERMNFQIMAKNFNPFKPPTRLLK